MIQSGRRRTMKEGQRGWKDQHGVFCLLRKYGDEKEEKERKGKTTKERRKGGRGLQIMKEERKLEEKR